MKLALPKANLPAALERGAGLFSFLIGLGLAVLLFHRPFVVENVLAVSLEDLGKAVAKHDGKCYRYRVEDASCQFSSSL